MTGKLGIIITRQSIITTLFLITFVESDRDNNTFFPRLPVGEYQIRLTRISYCDPPVSKIQVHWHLTKISPTQTDVEGNMTLKIPLDDSLLFNVHVDQRKSSGGWTNDVAMVRRKNACSDILNIVKKEYYVAFGYPKELLPASCPFLPRVYYTKGLSAHNWGKYFNLPKFLFYGKYRFRYSIINAKNEELACVQVMCEILRPWEIV